MGKKTDYGLAESVLELACHPLAAQFHPLNRAGTDTDEWKWAERSESEEYDDYMPGTEAAH